MFPSAAKRSTRTCYKASGFYFHQINPLSSVHTFFQPLASPIGGFYLACWNNLSLKKVFFFSTSYFYVTYIPFPATRNFESLTHTSSELNTHYVGTREEKKMPTFGIPLPVTILLITLGYTGREVFRTSGSLLSLP